MVPKRSNDFQAVVYFVRSHVDAQAVVTESALLPDRTGAGLREVDVLITSRVQGREFRIGVECRDHRRASDVVWVEQARTKQADLELDQMVLVSSNGFTGGAVAKAGYYGIELVTPDRPIPADGPLGRLGQPCLEFRDVIRDRLVSVSGRICLDGRLQSIPLAAGGAVFDVQGAQVSSIVQLVADSLDGADLRGVVAQGAGQSGELHVEVDDLVLRPADGGESVEAFVRMRAHPEQLLRLTALSAVVSARIVARPVPLAAGNLQEAAYAVGSGQVGEDQALVVFSESSAGVRMSVRLTDAHGEVTDWIADRSTQTLRPHGEFVTDPEPADPAPADDAPDAIG